MDYQEFFSKYNYNRKTDVENHTRFGLIYRAVDTKSDNKVYLRIMHVDDDRQAPTLEQEVEFVNALPDNPYIQRYTRTYRFEESTGQIDCAVMDFYDLGNMTTLLKNWKLDSGERSDLCGKILEAVKFLRDNGVKMGPFTPETIYVSESDGQLIPHLTDLSGFDTDNTGYEEQVKTMLAVDEAEEPTEEIIEEPTEEPEHTRKWLYLMGVLLTWVAIFALIFVLHRSRNSKDEGAAEAADSVKVEKVIYPADEFAKEEAAHADSVEKARADSIAAFKADSAAYVKKMAKKAMRSKSEKKAETPVESPAEENTAESPAATPAVPVATPEVAE